MTLQGTVYHRTALRRQRDRQNSYLVRCSFKAFDSALESKADIITRIGELRNRGLSAISVNTCLRCINAYLNWLHTERGKERIRISRLKKNRKSSSRFE